MSEKNRCTVCGETLELNGLNKLVQDLTGGLAGLSGIFAGHWNEENYSHSEIDTHIDDTTIHFEKTEISHNDLQDKGTKLHSEIDTHINDGDIHFEKTEISHNDLQDKGIKLHSEVDTHINDGDIHFEKTEISHNDLTEKGTNLHSAIDTHLTEDVIKTVGNVQGVAVGGNFSGSIGNIIHGSTQRCTHNHNLNNLTEKSHVSLTDKGTNTHSQIDTHITEDVIKTVGNVQGVAVGGDILGTVGEAKDKWIYPTLFYAVIGWVLGQSVWAIYQVPLSNTTATLTVSFYVNKGGNFKFVICYGNLAANSGYTMSCKFTSAYAVHGGITVNLTASADWDIPLGAYDVRLQDKCSNTLTIPDNAVVGIYFRKDDNAGGASGEVYVSGIYLERQ